MPEQLKFDDLKAACTSGGAGSMRIVTHLAPAAGAHAGIAPAKYAGKGGDGEYCFQSRYVDGELTRTVLIDSMGSTNNRAEVSLARGIREKHPQLSLTPRMSVTYPTQTFFDCELSHRFSDGHFRSGMVDGVAAVHHDTYIAARNSTMSDLRPLLEFSPISLVFGAWDSTRKSRQVRVAGPVKGEVIGVMADQSANSDIPRRGGARLDSLAAAYGKDKDKLKKLTAQLFESQLEPGQVKDKEKLDRLSHVGLGHVPPSLDELGLISCSTIIRSHVMSFATLRQMRFGLDTEGDVACRALLAALGYNLTLRSYAEPFLRANCDLVETAMPEMVLDGRYGKSQTLEFTPELDHADEILEQAIAAAVKAGIRWEGQEFVIEGNSLLAANAQASESD